ncbi:unnamed protein product [Prunus armeniaca]|nr:unnamed protein product [Prunus armeniaca]
MIWEGKNVILTGRKIIGATPTQQNLPLEPSVVIMQLRLAESSAHVKEDNFNIANKSKLKGSRPIPGVEHAAFKTSKLGKLGKGVHQSNSGLQKGKQKSLSSKELMTMYDVIYLQIYNEAQTYCYVSDNEKIEATVEVEEVRK